MNSIAFFIGLRHEDTNTRGDKHFGVPRHLAANSSRGLAVLSGLLQPPRRRIVRTAAHGLAAVGTEAAGRSAQQSRLAG